ncbi:glycosyl transferase [Marinilactibacillus psychrotolerans]|nr:glycosyl transferase [Marinilactibacillus psychrotolerans]
MKEQLKYFLSGIIIIILSTPLANLSIKMLYSEQNLAGEFVPILNGFIHSYMLIGALVFSIGAINLLREKF